MYENKCEGVCETCVRRYGCLTLKWGHCCTQFYQLNGKRDHSYLAPSHKVYPKHRKFVRKHMPVIKESATHRTWAQKNNKTFYHNIDDKYGWSSHAQI